MTISSNRRVVVRFLDEDTPDTSDAIQAFEADNEESAAKMEFKDLSSGNNSITVPSNAAAVTIIPPRTNTGDNEVTITLKGVNADTGFAIHPTDPTSIGLESTVTSFVLNVSDDLSGTRFIWS